MPRAFAKSVCPLRWGPVPPAVNDRSVPVAAVHLNCFYAGPLPGETSAPGRGRRVVCAAALPTLAGRPHHLVRVSVTLPTIYRWDNASPSMTIG